MAIDYGEARTGLALSDYTGLIATPLTTLTDRNMDWLVKRIAEAVSEHEVGAIVVGNPLNMDGSVGEKSEKCELLADKLRECVKIPVEMLDERLTTVEAHEIMKENTSRAGKSRKRRHTSAVDAVAAAVILQSYLDMKRNKL